MTTKADKTDEKDLKTDEKDVKEAATTIEAAPAAEPVAVVKVRFLRSHPDLAYHPGEEVEIPEAMYDKYIQDGEFFEKI